MEIEKFQIFVKSPNKYITHCIDVSPSTTIGEALTIASQRPGEDFDPDSHAVVIGGRRVNRSDLMMSDIDAGPDHCLWAVFSLNKYRAKYNEYKMIVVDGESYTVNVNKNSGKDDIKEIASGHTIPDSFDNAHGNGCPWCELKTLLEDDPYSLDDMQLINYDDLPFRTDSSSGGAGGDDGEETHVPCGGTDE